MNDNEKEEYTSEPEKDSIIDKLITDLLHDRPYYQKPMPGDKYRLTVCEKKRPKHGVKELDSCRSLIECEIYREIDGHFDISGVLTTDSKYIQVIMRGLPSKYYIELSNLKRLMSECTIDTDTRKCPGGEVTLAIIEIDRKRLLKNLIVR